MLRPPPGFALTNPSFPYPTFFRSKLIVPSFRGKHRRRPAGREAARAGIPAPDRTAGSSRQIDLGPMDVIGDTPPPCPADPAISPLHRRRSEEHTSELQSLMRTSYAVFCLKKKKQQH